MTTATADRPRVVVDYTPTARQTVAHSTLVDELLYGGAAGGGKSRFARAEALAFGLQVAGSATLILRRTFKDLNRAGGMIQGLRMEVPRELGTYNGTDHVLTLRDAGVRDIRCLTLVSAPVGVQAVLDYDPDVRLFTCALDRELNENAYILPGLGDAGDRIYGTK